jgi:hypothetical protein
MDDYSKEFKYWYDRIYLQSPSLCKLEYDDEKMWEAWKAAQTSFATMIKANTEKNRWT